MHIVVYIEIIFDSLLSWLARLPERSKGLCSGRNVFVLVGSSPTACKMKSCKIAEKSATDMDVGSPKGEVKTNARCIFFAFLFIAVHITALTRTQ